MPSPSGHQSLRLSRCSGSLQSPPSSLDSSPNVSSMSSDSSSAMRCVNHTTGCTGQRDLLNRFVQATGHALAEESTHLDHLAPCRVWIAGAVRRGGGQWPCRCDLLLPHTSWRSTLRPVSAEAVRRPSGAAYAQVSAEEDHGLARIISWHGEQARWRAGTERAYLCCPARKGQRRIFLPAPRQCVCAPLLLPA